MLDLETQKPKLYTCLEDTYRPVGIDPPLPYLSPPTHKGYITEACISGMKKVLAYFLSEQINS